MDTHAFEAMGSSFVRYECARGEMLPRHTHEEDHLTVIAAGSLVVRTDDKVVTRGPKDAPILFRAGRYHEIEAVEDGTVFLNIFAR